MEYIVVVLLLIIIFILWRFSFSPLKRNTKKKKDNSQENRGNPTGFCPLCSSDLYPGQRVKSKKYPSETNDTLMDVFGCPHCIPPYGKKDRICPVCNKKIPKSGYVIGRYFTRPDKQHLHVLGCTQCRKI